MGQVDGEPANVPASSHPNAEINHRLDRYPSERLSMLDTLRGFTTGAAYAAFQEAQLGSLEVGKLADFIVVDKDIFAVQDFEIPEMGVKATVLGGRLMRGRLQ